MRLYASDYRDLIRAVLKRRQPLTRAQVANTFQLVDRRAAATVLDTMVTDGLVERTFAPGGHIYQLPPTAA